MAPAICGNPAKLILFSTSFEALTHQDFNCRAKGSSMTATWPRAFTLLRRVTYGVMTTGLLAGVTLAFAPKGEDTLLVWASDQAHHNPDFIAVIDFERDSPTYGQVLRTVPLSGPERRATNLTTSASPATAGRWRSAAC